MAAEREAENLINNRELNFSARSYQRDQWNRELPAACFVSFAFGSNNSIKVAKRMIRALVFLEFKKIKFVLTGGLHQTYLLFSNHKPIKNQNKWCNDFKQLPKQFPLVTLEYIRWPQYLCPELSEDPNVEILCDLYEQDCQFRAAIKQGPDGHPTCIKQYIAKLTEHSTITEEQTQQANRSVEMLINAIQENQQLFESYYQESPTFRQSFDAYVEERYKAWLKRYSKLASENSPLSDVKKTNARKKVEAFIKEEGAADLRSRELLDNPVYGIYCYRYPEIYVNMLMGTNAPFPALDVGRYKKPKKTNTKPQRRNTDSGRAQRALSPPRLTRQHRSADRLESPRDPQREADTSLNSSTASSQRCRSTTPQGSPRLSPPHMRRSLSQNTLARAGEYFVPIWMSAETDPTQSAQPAEYTSTLSLLSASGSTTTGSSYSELNTALKHLTVEQAREREERRAFMAFQDRRRAVENIQRVALALITQLSNDPSIDNTLKVSFTQRITTIVNGNIMPDAKSSQLTTIIEELERMKPAESDSDEGETFSTPLTSPRDDEAEAPSIDGKVASFS